MSKTYSNVFDRAMHIMVLLLEAKINLPAGEVRDLARTPKRLASMLCVERQTLYSSLNLLLEYDFVRKEKRGRNTVYHLTVKGIKFYHQNEAYVRSLAEINQRVIDHNTWL